MADRYTDIEKQVEQIVDNQDDKSITVPDTVKDQVAYKRYVKLKDAKSLQRDNRMITTSDVNLTIDPIGNLSRTEKLIVHLPSDEQDTILKRCKAIKVIYLKVGALKLKAYGMKRPRYHHTLQMGLLDERKSELIEYYGRMLTTKEVHKIITVEWGYEVAIETLRKFKKTYIDKIKDRQEHFQRDFNDIRLGHKKGRLEELVWMYNSRKQKYEDTETKTDYQLMLQTLRAIRDEVEDKSLRIDHNINAKLEITVNNHIQTEIMKGLTINDIIIARVAARMNINPRFLITRLHNSAYAKHSGFIRPDSDLDKQDVTYPSSIVYNWDKIEKQHKKYGDIGLDEAEWEEVTEPEKQRAGDLKDVLLAKILDKKSDLSTAKQRIVKNSDPKKE